MSWTTTNESLIDRLRDPHDEAAWRRFDALYGEVILRYAGRRGLGFADAEDVRQIVLLSLVRALPNFELQHERGRFRSYLGRVVGNAVQRYRARPYRLREVVEPDLAPFEDHAPTVESSDLWEREWTEHHLRRALETVRQTFDARSVEIFGRLLRGDATDTVASEFNASEEAVHKVRQRVRERLRQIVSRQVADEAAFLAAWPPRQTP